MSESLSSLDLETARRIDTDAIVRNICKGVATPEELQEMQSLACKTLWRTYKDNELIIEGFEEALCNLAANKEKVRSADNPGAYFLVMVRNATSHVLRKTKQRSNAELFYAVLPDALDTGERLITPLIRDENHEIYQQFLKQKDADGLPHHARIVRLRLEENIPHDGIAKSIKREEHFVRGTYTRCVQQLRELLELE